LGAGIADREPGKTRAPAEKSVGRLHELCSDFHTIRGDGL